MEMHFQVRWKELRSVSPPVTEPGSSSVAYQSHDRVEDTEGKASVTV